MGTIVVHAGSPKAGSSSIQTWLARNAATLRERHGVGIVVARSREAGNEGRRLHVDPYESGGVNSGAFIFAYLAFNRSPRTLDVFFGGLDRAAGEHPITVVSSEGFAQFIAAGDTQFLERLDALGASHEVRVAYYFRPQHTCLEA